MPIHRKKLKDLNDSFVKQLKEQYLDEEMELEVRVRRKVKPAGVERKMNEEEFWKIIDLLDWEHEGDDEAVLQSAVDYLSRFTSEDIAAFEDILSEKLFQLDGQKYAEHTGENAYGTDDYFSADLFLYSRCCIVANGKGFYEEVLEDPGKMVKDLTFEALLYLAEEAHLKKTGKHLEHIPAYNYETFFNSEGWGSQRNRLL